MFNRVFIILLVVIAGCSSKETPVPVEYTGPLSEMQDVDMLYSENDRVKVKVVTKKMFEFKNGDREFPEGIYLEFYNAEGILSSTLKANNAYYFKEKDQWRGREKVEVVNIEKKQQLNTEELFWEPKTKKIFTEKFVAIKLENELIYGTGLEADQDLSNYVIKKQVSADIELKEEN